MAICFRHDDFEGIVLYCTQRYAKIVTEGPAEGYFDENAVAENVEEEAKDEEMMLPTEIVEAAQREQVEVQDARALAIELDDDNEPAPENVPDDNAVPAAGQWGHNNICSRKMTGASNVSPTIRLPREFPVTKFRLFERFFFRSFLCEVLLPLINQHIAPGEPVTLGEFYRFIGLWLLMATIQGPTRRDYWATDPISPFRGAPIRLNEFMSRCRFEAILTSLRYNNNPPPAYRDPFFEIRQMVVAWNENMCDIFVPGWISCLDESMSYWTNIYTCPGFMCVPRKPWPFGNEWHSICCGLSGVMYAIELVEGKSQPRELPAPEFEHLGGKTVGLLVRLTRAIWNTGKVVVLDSGFCVARALTQLSARGVFGAALIKKRRFWPKHVDGDMIRGHFDASPVGHADCYRMTIPDDNGKLDIHGFKEPDYVMLLMATYGTLERVGPQHSRSWEDADGQSHSTRVQYPEIVYNHYKYRHSVDDHNNRRQSPISLEKTWSTHWWPNRVFAFLIAISEVNTLKAWTNIYQNPDMETLDFRKQLADELINNPFLAEETAAEARGTRKSARNSGHELLSLPPKKEMVRRADGGLPISLPMPEVRQMWQKVPGLLQLHPWDNPMQVLLP